MVSYAPVVALLKKLKSKKVFEVLHVHGGKVFEGGTSNFFMVKNGTVITPKEGVLQGITRGVVVDLVKKSFPLEEREVTVAELAKADEVFYTATLKGVMPVTVIDGKKSWQR
jgi:branched-subunit amino acid aminotransferase/4-amino-4-deoxychorismate lyase